ncbi:MAG: pentapeptide repeat-containing protein, partial [Coleofasciculaceae cyanobacterium]
ARADSNSDTTPQNTPSTNQIRSNSSGWGVNSNYPIVSNSQISQLPCYMQTEDGKILDLWRLCAGGMVKQLLTTGRCLKCDLSGVNLSNLDLSNLDLSGANLTGANLTGTNLSGTNLTNTIMPDGKIQN